MMYRKKELRVSYFLLKYDPEIFAREFNTFVMHNKSALHAADTLDNGNTQTKARQQSSTLYTKVKHTIEAAAAAAIS